ncbi:MAG: hypothetical protein KGO51_01835 [Alphaproteobacteria bacterium]|nr:hypothetical protein [Alphaproteobacteria bacterium]
MDGADLETATSAAGDGDHADRRLIELEQAQLRERRRREALPLREADAFEASCLRSDRLEAEMLALCATGREGFAVKFRELTYALRHHVPVEPWIESLGRDLEPAGPAGASRAA